MTKIALGWNYNGSYQTFTIPAAVTSVHFELWGASGGAPETTGITPGLDIYANSNTVRAPGGYVVADVPVTPGVDYYIYVGGNGGNSSPYGSGVAGITGAPGGFNGGGAGGNGYPAIGTFYAAVAGSGGGGATDIRTGGTALSNRILVAGGGGGHGGHPPIATGPTTATINATAPDPPYGDGTGDTALSYFSAGNGSGGYGGADNAGVGGGAATSWFSQTYSDGVGGAGGNQTAGGTAGLAPGGGAAGGAGTSGVGGAGGSATSGNVASLWSAGGGGGGGGYFGGGGGGTGNMAAGGGGGGSNFGSVAAYTAGTFFSWPHAWPPAAAGASGAGGFVRATYTQPPLPPRIDTPINGSGVDPTIALPVTFEQNTLVAGDYMTAYDIAIQDVTASGSYVQTHVAIPNNGAWTHTYAASTFVNGHLYNLRVRTYDKAGDVGDWTTIRLQILTPPAAPVVTNSPNGTVTASTVTTTWTNPSGSPETQYQLDWLDANNKVLQTVGPIVTGGTRVNLVKNPDFGTDTNFWTPNVKAGGTLPTLTRTTTTNPSPTTSAGKVSWSGSTNSTEWITTTVDTVVGQTYVCYCSVAAGTSSSDTGATLYVNGSIAQSTAWGSVGAFQVLLLTFTATDRTMDILVRSSSNAPHGSIFVGKVMCEINPTGILQPWFDGSFLNGNSGTAAWTGTAHESTSTLTAADVLTYNWSTGPLPHNIPIRVRVRYQNIANPGVWSTYGLSAAVTLNINPPGVPSVVVQASDSAGVIVLLITYVDTPNVTLYGEVFRRDITNDGPEIRLATGLIPDPATHMSIYEDFTPATDVEYRYRVRAWSVAGGYADIGDTT